jgi:hypothetical protein
MKFLWIFLVILAVITQVCSLPPPQPTKKSADDTSDSDEIPFTDDYHVPFDEETDDPVQGSIQNRVLLTVAVIDNCKEGFVMVRNICRRLISSKKLKYGMCAKNKVFIDGRCQTHIRDFLQFS